MAPQNTFASFAPGTFPGGAAAQDWSSASTPGYAPVSVGEASESQILERILRRFPQAAAAVVGPGDDAAVMAPSVGSFVVTSDMMIHGPDFRLAWTRPYELGWKAAVTNLADVYAMGARPTGLVVALAVSADIEVAALERMADGLADACARLAPGCGIVGGDLSVSDTFTVAITAFGDLEERPAVLRSGARPGDTVALAGAAGLAAHGIDLLFERGVDSAGLPSREAGDALRATREREIAAQLLPYPPLPAGLAASRAGASAMMDVSDGLALDASRIATASGVSIDFSAAAFADASDVQRALRGGEDHALLATFPPGAALPTEFRPIGAVLPARAEGAVSLDGAVLEGNLGWDPYTAWDGHNG
ncbi:thiamine-phosphate kinase [Mycetocola spongiae]|uniref:thiamine-phosphate kinase n=1 Tax=Mycetocola spongiae TaxID=2859226 RepID=UPI001CF4B753|nr:thiamine-phosphate kinase [Mycetocola spongiae]UCR89155.1 thiamine-phosphate kinase [Mycetocola spongiae]